LRAGNQAGEFKLLHDPPDVSRMTCLTAGQPEIARWQAEHPDRQVKRWHRTPGDSRAASL
jgi:hypothetical protein